MSRSRRRTWKLESVLRSNAPDLNKPLPEVCRDTDFAVIDYKSAPHTLQSRLLGHRPQQSQEGLLQKSTHKCSISSLDIPTEQLDSVHEVHQDDFHANGIDKGGLSQEARRRPLLWTPFWLRSTTLFSFMVLFALLLMSLILMWHFAKANNGFSTRLSTNHYTWTYGPTAVLVVVVSLWRQVDYQCKILTPWKELQGGKAPTSRHCNIVSAPGTWLQGDPVTASTNFKLVEASRSLLLDYVSPLEITTVWQALKNRHIAVLSSVLGFASLKLIIVFSTGLLFLDSTTVFESEYPSVATSKLSTTGFNMSANLLTAVSNSPVYAYYGVTAHGLQLPNGTKPMLAYETIESPSTRLKPRNSTISAETDAFMPQFDCEVASVNWTYPSRIPVNGSLKNVYEFNTTITASSLVPHTFNTPITVLDPWYEKVPPRQWRPTTIAPKYEYWVLLMADIGYTQVIDEAQTILNVSNASVTVNAITAVVCNPYYTVHKVQVDYDNSLGEHVNSVNVTNVKPDGVIVESGTSEMESRDLNFTPPSLVAGPSSTDAALPGLTNGNLSEIITIAISRATLFGDAVSEKGAEPPDTMFKLMALANNNRNYSFLLDGQAMARTAQSVFQGIAAQFAQQNLTIKHNGTLSGQSKFQEERLFVRESSLWAMVSAFAVLIVLTAVVLGSRPRRVCPRSPDSVGALAACLSNSGELQDLLSGTGASRTSNLRRRLASHKYSTRFAVKAAENGMSSQKADERPGSAGPVAHDASPKFSIEATRVLYEDDRVAGKAAFRWWRPFVLKRPVIVLVLVLPLLVIACLEALQRESNRREGFAAIPTSHGTISPSAYINYIPALVMLLVATLFNSLDFTVSVFTPFSRLRAGNAPARSTLLFKPLGRLPPLALLELVRTRHWGALLSTIGALTGSVLTIIVSGLYVIDNVHGSRNATVQRVDRFDPSWISNGTLGDDNTAAVVLSLVEHLNMSYPQFTFGEIALPNVSYNSLSQNLSSAELSVNLPAWRASLNCTVLPSDILVLNYSAVQENITSATVNVQILPDRDLRLPEGCQVGPFNTSSPLFHNQQMDLLISRVEGRFAGELRDLFGNPEGCPSLAFAFGYFEYEETPLENVTVMVCHQTLQQISSNVSFTLPNLSINPALAPTPDENSVTYISNSSGGTAFTFQLQNNTEKQLASFDQGGVSAASQTGRDPFFDVLLFGKEGIPAPELVGPQNVDRLTSAINHVYREYMAQAISLNMRKGYTGFGDPPILDATLQDQNNRRVKQNAGSKLTLQILLGVMLACGGAAYFLTDMRNTLTHNPCSIAGTMSLLAGSEVVDERTIPSDAPWLDEKGLKRTGSLQQHRFGMGWRNINGKEAFGIHAEHEEDLPSRDWI